MQSRCQEDLLLPCRCELAWRVHRKAFSENNSFPGICVAAARRRPCEPRTEAFNFEEIVSCRSAYTRVSGGRLPRMAHGRRWSPRWWKD